MKDKEKKFRHLILEHDLTLSFMMLVKCYFWSEYCLIVFKMFWQGMKTVPSREVQAEMDAIFVLPFLQYVKKSKK